MNYKLEKIIKYSVENVGYYANNQGYESLDYQKIPILTKEIVKKNQEKFISSKYKKSELIIEQTSGSTGIPLRIYRSRGDEIRTGKSLWKFRKKFANISPSDKYVNFFIRRYKNNGEINDDKIIYNKNILELSLVDLSIEMINKYIEAIIDFKPTWIFGPPSAIYYIAKEINKNKENFDFNFLQLIELSGEYCSDYQREYIQNAFSTKTLVMYGAMEMLCIAYMCDCGNYHINEDNVYLETNDKNEIIVTCYNSLAMPLLKYKIGDFGKVYKKKCKYLKEEMCLQILGGREGQYVEFKDKRYNSAIFYIIIKDINEIYPESIAQFQFIKRNIKDNVKFECKFIRGINFNDKIYNLIQEKFIKYFGIKLSSISEVELIPLINNKLRYYIEEME